MAKLDQTAKGAPRPSKRKRWTSSELAAGDLVAVLIIGEPTDEFLAAIGREGLAGKQFVDGTRAVYAVGSEHAGPAEVVEALVARFPGIVAVK